MLKALNRLSYTASGFFQCALGIRCHVIFAGQLYLKIGGTLSSDRISQHSIAVKTISLTRGCMISSSAKARVLFEPSSWRWGQKMLLGKTLGRWSWAHGSLQGLGGNSAIWNPKLEMEDLTHSHTFYLSALMVLFYIQREGWLSWGQKLFLHD